jgi:hypothetical protein
LDIRYPSLALEFFFSRQEYMCRYKVLWDNRRNRKRRKAQKSAEASSNGCYSWLWKTVIYSGFTPQEL